MDGADVEESEEMRVLGPRREVQSPESQEAADARHRAHQAEERRAENGALRQFSASQYQRFRTVNCATVLLRRG